MFEAVIVFVRDGMVRPAVGRHDADRFLPLILTLFFFILFCNLFGLIPCLGSPTASIGATGPLALVTFLVGMGAGMKKYGPVRFWTGLCPPMELPFLLQLLLVPLIWVLEVVGTLIRYSVLAVRLLANMFGGHLVLAIILGVHSGDGRFDVVVRRGADGRVRRHGHQFVGVAFCVSSGVYFCVPRGVVHRHGRSSALASKPDRSRGFPFRSIFAKETSFVNKLSRIAVLFVVLLMTIGAGIGVGRGRREAGRCRQDGRRARFPHGPFWPVPRSERAW